MMSEPSQPSVGASFGLRDVAHTFFNMKEFIYLR